MTTCRKDDPALAARAVTADHQGEHAWITAAWVYVAFILDDFVQRIVACHDSICKDADLVITLLRMAVWHRDHQGYCEWKLDARVRSFPPSHVLRV